MSKAEEAFVLQNPSMIILRHRSLETIQIAKGTFFTAQEQAAPQPPGTRHTTPSAGPGTPSPPGRRRACWEIQSTSGRYASYWKAILFKNEVLENPLRLTCDKHQRKVSVSLLHSLCVNGPLPVLPCRVLW